MRKPTIVAAIAGALVLTFAATIGSPPSASAGGAERRTEERTRAFVDAFQREDLDAIEEMSTQEITTTLPLSFTGTPEPAAVFVGQEQSLGYVSGVFNGMQTIRFTDVRISVTNRGRTSFLQANGDFVANDGRSYRNVYIIRFDWEDGKIVRTDEYANPVAFCITFGGPDC